MPPGRWISDEVSMILNNRWEEVCTALMDTHPYPDPRDAKEWDKAMDGAEVTHRVSREIVKSVFKGIDWVRVLHMAAGRHALHMREGNHKDPTLAPYEGLCGACVQEALLEGKTCEALGSYENER